MTLTRPAAEYRIWQVIAASAVGTMIEWYDFYAGLYYPIAVAILTFVIGSLLLRETHSVLIWRELETTKGHKLVSDIERPD